MAGAGAALLLADKLRENERKMIGWTLFLIGALSTIPLAVDVFSKRK
jgi:H+/gluconate symporter-like permease